MDEYHQREEATRLAQAAARSVAESTNEATLRHRLELELEKSCRALGLPWVPYQLDLTLTGRNEGRKRFVDVVHGGVVIEYERPNSLAGRALRDAQLQAVEYAELLHDEEGRALERYVLVVWDGALIAFGRFTPTGPEWSSAVHFDAAAAERLLAYHATDGQPLVHPQALSVLLGPSSGIGQTLLPKLFDAVLSALPGASSSTALLFKEWRRLFGQASGAQSQRLREFLTQQGDLHERDYDAHPDVFLFALYTYLALVAKAVAAAALPRAWASLSDTRVRVADRVAALETGRLFAAAGISNMLAGDFFSWYRADPSWPAMEDDVGRLLARLADMSFEVEQKDPETTRDLFKGMYQTFVPGPLRHALGEFYTPDWLAAHALDEIEWRPEDPLLDPTCGSGTFLLEALKRRLRASEDLKLAAHELLDGLAGLDLNPLAVLCARASIVVYLADRFHPGMPVRLPIYLADAVSRAGPMHGDTFGQVVQTEKGRFTFALPGSLIRRHDFFDLFERARVLLDDGYGLPALLEALEAQFPFGSEERTAVADVLTHLAVLRDQGWDGLWCAILADRFAAAAIPPTTHAAGNPPWVKWSNLPPEYAALIKDECAELGVFSDDSWVGGIESDISTVITFETVRSRLAPGGRLAFFITGTVFANESSQGFRRFRIPGSDVTMSVHRVEDFDLLRPFESVSNHPTLLVLERGDETLYPVPYLRYRMSAAGELEAERFDAAPVPGTDAGPWLIGTPRDHAVWARVFGSRTPSFRARKGVTTDLNGLWWLRPIRCLERGLVEVANDPQLGRKQIARVNAPVEAQHVYPLLRGKDVHPFRADVDPGLTLLAPQRGIHGDPDLPAIAPRAYEYLAQFKQQLASRSSYRRYQPRQAYWSLWSIGPYSFSEHKVVWRELSGRRFAAALVEPYDHPLLGRKPVLCDHKLYFVPCASRAEAAYLTGVLNAPVVAAAINSYSARLSTGVNVVEYLAIPKFDVTSAAHLDVVRLVDEIVGETRGVDATTLHLLDDLIADVFRLPAT